MWCWIAGYLQCQPRRSRTAGGVGPRAEPKESRARTTHKVWMAPQGAGVIHTDLPHRALSLPDGDGEALATTRRHCGDCSVVRGPSRGADPPRGGALMVGRINVEIDVPKPERAGVLEVSDCSRLRPCAEPLPSISGP